MKFTYYAYENLVNKMKGGGYKIDNYHNYDSYDKVVIMRHDVDFDLKKAVEFARFENKIGVSSTYFILLTSNFYNILSKESKKMIDEIIKNGHEIGLHFDEVRYGEKAKETLGVEKLIKSEMDLLAEILNCPINSVSMHRPSLSTLKANYQMDGVVNSYSEEFFRKFKYVSDSRMHWRENIEKIVKENQYKALHVLTHPFWYGFEEKDQKRIILEFIAKAQEERVLNLKENITNLDEIIDMERY